MHWEEMFKNICEMARLHKVQRKDSNVEIADLQKALRNAMDLLSHCEVQDLFAEVCHRARQVGIEAPNFVQDTVRLSEMAETLGITSEELDEEVHDAMSRDGSSANNGGIEAQIRALVECYGAKDTEAILRRMTKE